MGNPISEGVTRLSSTSAHQESEDGDQTRSADGEQERLQLPADEAARKTQDRADREADDDLAVSTVAPPARASPIRLMSAALRP